MVRIATALLLFTLTFPHSALAEPASPEVLQSRAYARELERQPRGQTAWVLVEALWQDWDTVGPGEVVPPLERVRADGRADRWTRDAAAWHLAEAAWRQGDADGARAAGDRLGVVRSFLILGPLDNEGDAGTERQWPPERDPAVGLALDAALAGDSREVTWRQVTVPDASPLGVLHFQGFLHPMEETCVYAVTSIELERQQTALIHTGASGALILWVNGQEAVRDLTYRRLHADRFALRASLGAGTNRVMAKVCGDSRHIPALLLRVTDTGGAPLGEGFSNEPALARREVSPPRRGGRPQSLDTPFRTFWRRATATRAPARRDQLAAARYLHLTGSDDAADPVAPDLAAAGAGDPDDGALDIEAQLLAAELAEDHNAARRRLAAVVERTPREPRALAALAGAIADGPCPQDAMPVTRRALAAATGSVTAAVLEARLLEQRGLSAAGLAVIEAALERSEAPVLLEAGTDLARGARHPAKVLRLATQLARARHNQPAAHRTLATLARDRGDRDAAVGHLDALERTGWHQLSQRIWAARVLEQLQLEEASEARLRRLTLQTPHHHRPWSTLGRLLAGSGRRDEAVPLLRRSLQLHPQDQENRELLAFLLGEAPLEDRFMEEPETFLARRGGEGRGEHAQWLLDLTVVQVHPSGLSSRFRQVAVEIHDEEGAADWRTHGIGFVPDEQQVTVRRARVHHSDGSIEESSARFVQQVSDPSIRMYYDERAEVIELPRLRPGDVVEFAYRVDDVAARNLFGDYFGDIALLQGYEPRRRVAYVLVHPRNRRIFSSAPDSLPTLRHSEACEPAAEGSCTRTWEATDVEGLQREEGQPPLAELAARLTVSTYGSWDAVGRWYWGLVRDQLTPDDALRQVVSRLVAGIDDERGRVRAIHGWVVEHTRYVALEFGIHGYMPYRVTQIVDRGFGDCKDKASLLVTMLGLADIEASLVLIRTRHAGRVEPQPASLSLFDHAIAYVPSLDLFLDGTAEQSGTAELPWMDQGATALIVARDGSSRLVTSPIDEPARNRTLQQIRVAVDGAPSQAPRLTSRETIQGHQAARLRYHFQAAALRRDRLEARLARSWPGARLAQHRFVEIEDRERSVEIEASFAAPSVVLEQGGRLTVELARPRELTRRWARRSERQTALELRRPPQEQVEERIIELPPNRQVAELPAPTTVRSEFGTLEMTSRSSGREVRVITRLTIGRDRIAPADYPAFRRFCQAVDQALERRLVLGGESGR